MNNTGQPTFGFPWFLRHCQGKVLDKSIPWNVKYILSLWLHLIEWFVVVFFLLVIWIELGQTWPSTPSPPKNYWEETAGFEPFNRWHWCTWRKVTGYVLSFSSNCCLFPIFDIHPPEKYYILVLHILSNTHCSNSWHYGCFGVSHGISNFEEVWLYLEPNAYLPVLTLVVFFFLRGLTHLGKWLVLFIFVAVDQFQSCRKTG